MNWKYGICLVLLASISDWVTAVTPMISVGYQHSLALRSDGTVLSWGSDQSGQLGSGVLPYETRPGRVQTLTNFQGIAAAVSHSLAIGRDATVWAWGANEVGQLGDGTTANRSAPVQVKGLLGVSKVCGGSSYSLALRTDGSVWAWGENHFGVFGNGSQASSPVAVQVPGVVEVSAIACGNQHVLALQRDGSVLAWGSNLEGALGDGSTLDRLNPVKVQALSGVVAIAAGNDFSAALRQDGTVWEWGITAPYSDPHGAPRKSPVQTPGVSGIAAIAGGVNSYFIVAISSNGSDWWRWVTANAPEAQPSVGPLKGVAASYGQGFLLKADGSVLGFSFGNGNPFGNLGDGTTIYRDAPGPVLDIANIVQVASGNWHGLALDASGNVWSWGLDSSGQLGRARALSRSVAAPVVGLPIIAQVSAGYSHSLAVDSTGSAWAWGSNGYGELGDASYLDTGTPVKLSAISDIQYLVAAGLYSLALKRDGSVWGWGSTLPGAASNPAVPTLMHVNATAVAAGAEHCLALNRDGTVWAWGSNASGQLGDGTKTDHLQPIQVPGLSGVMAIAASNGSSYALKSDGTVLGWGENLRGQLGDITAAQRLAPVAIAGLNGVVEFVAGASHALARKADRSVWGWSWGYETSGELGAMAANPPSAVARVAGADAVEQLSAGADVSAMLRQDGLVLMGGRNLVGQLGDGTFAQSGAFVLSLNRAANGYLNLKTDTAITVPSALKVPFFVKALGGISDTSATVNTTIKFNAPDIGKSGAVYVTARVPTGSLSAGTPNAMMASVPRKAILQTNATTSTTTPFALMQLTASGWQPVVNGQLIPYASGVLGDQLAAQSILNATDTTNLQGSEFCVGYGASATEMVSANLMRAVASIGSSASNSCEPIALPQGWNLLGNGLNQSIAVTSLYADTSWVNSVWKWNSVNSQWQYYAPSLDATALQSFAQRQGFGVLSAIEPGEGYWVNTKTTGGILPPSGSTFTLSGANLSQGWNLKATGVSTTASAFNTSLSASLTSLWAWDAATQNWYFYAPSLEAQGAGALTNYISSHGFKDFPSNGKALGPNVGFWVNR